MRVIIIAAIEGDLSEVGHSVDLQKILGLFKALNIGKQFRAYTYIFIKGSFECFGSNEQRIGYFLQGSNSIMFSYKIHPMFHQIDAIFFCVSEVFRHFLL